MQELTERQRQVFEFIADFIRQQKFAPTKREIAAQFGFRSPRAATDHLTMLERKGWLHVHRDKARGIELRITSGLPVIGIVAAGTPIEAIENQEQHLDLPDNTFTDKPDYLLRVQGDSMRDAHILDGDLVAVRKTLTAKHGQIVVARIDNEVTVKRLEIKQASITLMPANPDYSPICIDNEDFALEGIVCGMVRSLVG